jgi:uncharacterized coiled-coil protein SlyX
VLDAIATTRRFRAQLRVTIPERFKGVTRPCTPDASPATRAANMTAQGQAMVASRRLDSQLKRERVAAAVDARAATGRELSIAAIARHAGVSRKFIYAHPDLRAQSEERARQHSRRTTAAAVADGHVTVASLRADLANAKAHNHRLREQLRALEQRLSEALGRDIADQLEPAPHRRPKPREFSSDHARDPGDAVGDALLERPRSHFQRGAQR